MSLDLSFLGSTAGAWWVFWVAVAGWVIFLGLDPFGKSGSRRRTAPGELLPRVGGGGITGVGYEGRRRVRGGDDFAGDGVRYRILGIRAAPACIEIEASSSEWAGLVVRTLQPSYPFTP